MSLIAQSAAQKARVLGFKANLRTRGRIVTITSSNDDDNEAEITVLIDDLPILQDPGKPAQARNPVYVGIGCLYGALEDPTAVTAFSEGDKEYKVLEYKETAGDRISWKFMCEAQRDVFPLPPPIPTED